MLDLIRDNLTTLLSLTAIGAFLGGLVGLWRESVSRRKEFIETVGEEFSSLMAVLTRFRGDIDVTRDGFADIVTMLTPDGGFSRKLASDDPAGPGAPDDDNPIPDDDPDEDDDDSPETGLALAEKLLAGVIAIPALPKLPDIERDFSVLAQNDMLSPILRQLTNFDTDGINATIGEFKSLVETTLAPGIEKAKAEGLDFMLEPETIETLSKGAGEFVRTISGLGEGLDDILKRLEQVRDSLL